MTTGDRWLHQSVASSLRGRIERGELRPGDQLPTIHALAEQYGVSIAVVRQALDLLRHEGVVLPRRGSGVYVRPAPLPPPAGRLLWRPERTPLGGRTIVRDVREMDAPIEVRSRLDVDSDVRVVVRRSTLVTGDAPVQVADHFYPLDVAEQAPRLRAAGPTQDSGLDMLAEAGVDPVDAEEELLARTASAAEVELLGLSVVVQVTRVVYDPLGRAIEVMLAAVNPNVVAFRHRFPLS